MKPNFDDAALIAAAEVVRKAGAQSFEIEHTDPEAGPVTWEARANFKGQTLKSDGTHADPVSATDALARQILEGGLCTYCQRRVTLTDTNDLSKCYRHRVGAQWFRSCEIEHPEDERSNGKPPHSMNKPQGSRAQRRAAERNNFEFTAHMFSAHKVPSISIDGASREPICLDCVERVNPMRKANGLPPITYDDDAYAPMPAAELQEYEARRKR